MKNEEKKVKVEKNIQYICENMCRVVSDCNGDCRKKKEPKN
jgi:hypothetical protein